MLKRTNQTHQKPSPVARRASRLASWSGQPQRQLNRGVSLAELLVSTVVGGVVIAVAFGGAMANREFYLKDQQRTQVNQALRSSMDILGSDIQQTGENLRRNDPFFPAVELTRNPATPTNENWNSVLTIRRSLGLPVSVCQNLGTPENSATNTAAKPASNITQIQVFERDLNPNDNVRPPGNCGELVDEQNPNSSPRVAQTLTDWNARRVNNGGILRAFLYDGNGGGQFVTITNILAPDNNTRLITFSGFNGAKFYASGTARIYLLEERTYQLDNEGNLEVSVDGGAPQDLVSGIQRFQVRLYTRPPNNADGTPPANPDALVEHLTFCEQLSTADRCFDPTAVATNLRVDAWSAINNFRVRLVAADPSQGAGDVIQAKQTEASRTLEEQLFPRNVKNFSNQ